MGPMHAVIKGWINTSTFQLRFAISVPRGLIRFSNVGSRRALDGAEDSVKRRVASNKAVKVVTSCELCLARVYGLHESIALDISRINRCIYMHSLWLAWAPSTSKLQRHVDRGYPIKVFRSVPANSVEALMVRRPHWPDQ